MENLLEDNQHQEEDDTATRSSCNPLKVLVPITNACLILMAIIFVLALGIVFMIVLVAIRYLYI